MYDNTSNLKTNEIDTGQDKVQPSSACTMLLSPVTQLLVYTPKTSYMQEH